MKKAQAALEFLTTYGWAFMVVLIMMGAMSYFGLLSPSKFLPERCTMTQEFSCLDQILYGDNAGANAYRVIFKLRQGLGKTIQLRDVTVTYPTGLIVTCNNAAMDGDSVFDDALPQDWLPKQTAEIQCIPAGTGLLISGEKEKVDVEITYRLEPTGYDHYGKGEIYSNAQ